MSAKPCFVALTLATGRKSLRNRPISTRSRARWESSACLAPKALASGIPIGACLARGVIAEAFGAGSHGSTFGGNAVAAAAAVATLETMTAPEFLPGVRARAAHFRAGLDRIAAKSAKVKAVRGLGFIQGMQMLWLGDCDLALAGGVSESIHTFGIFAAFKSQGALATHPDPTKASRPFDQDRSGLLRFRR